MAQTVRQEKSPDNYVNVPEVPPGKVHPEFEGITVQVDGPVKGALLRDEETHVQGHLLRLRRKVEIYQWSERKVISYSYEPTNERNRQGRRSSRQVQTFSYSRVWSPKPIDSYKYRELRRTAVSLWL